MTPRTVAAVGGVAGGLAWLARVALVGAGSEPSSGLVTGVHYAALGLLCLGLAAAGYALVARAPLWLRLIVAVAVPALVLIVALLADQALDAALESALDSESWWVDELSYALGGAVALLLGLAGLRRSPDRSGQDHHERRPSGSSTGGRRRA